MEIVEKKPSELIPYANNSRTHSDEQVAQICASIREYGFTNPILIDEEGTIIAGHGRAKAAMRPGADFLVWHADNHRYSFETAMRDAGFKTSQVVVWVKNTFSVVCRQDFKWMHEPCLYGWKEGAGHYFKPEFNNPTVFREDKPRKADLHPTMKPVALCCSLIRLTSGKGDLVLDLFGGSGSTLIACELLGRRCFMMEYDPRYADVIVRRWEKMTGRKASREENDGKRGE